MDKNNPTPVTILGGYLGCGKTTLVNHLLRKADGTRLAILVNDFGELPIDADLIESKDDKLISLSGGCVCCSYGDDLTSALMELRTLTPLPDHILIEASGVALPGAIGNTLSLLTGLTLQSIIVLADAATIGDNACNKYLADTIERQLSDADLIILNKLDLVSPEETLSLKNLLTEKCPDTPLIAVTHSQLTPAVLLDNYQPEQISTNPGTETNGFVHDPTLFQSFNIAATGRMDITRLAQQLSNSECALLRAKGFVMDTDGVIKTLQVVGRRWSINPAPAGVDTGIVCIGIRGEFSELHIRNYCALVA